MTNKERNLLKKMASGALDGFVGDELTTSGGSTVWKVIKNGVPAMFKQGPGRRFLMARKMSISMEFFTLYRNGIPTIKSWNS